MPANFVRVEREIARKIKLGKIPKYYYRNVRGGRKRYKSNPYALARVAVKFYGPTHRRKTTSRRIRR